MFILLLPLSGWAQDTIDCYSQSNGNWLYSLYNGSPNTHIGQVFTSSNYYILDSCKFYLRKSGSPTGYGYAYLYNITGDYGEGCIPIGSQIATSDAFDVSTLSTTLGLKKFTFSGINSITLSASTYYCVTFSFTGGNSSNYVRISTDSSSPTHSGNLAVCNSGGNWSAPSAEDCIFYVYGTITSAPSSKKNIFLWTNF